MTEYIIKAPKGTCRNPKEVRWQITDAVNGSTADLRFLSSDDRSWPPEKPINGCPDINAAYRRLEFLVRAHPSCKCAFEVEEV